MGVAEDLRAGGDIETPISESGVGDSGIHPVYNSSRRDKTVVGTLPGRDITRGL